MLPLIFESRTTSPQKVMLQSIKSIKEWEASQPPKLSEALSTTHNRLQLTPLLARNHLLQLRRGVETRFEISGPRLDLLGPRQH
ncbi:unnamed protein product [Brassica oleracea]|uniref:Uncharacterized protein n=1 Tax=Brassica oleracea TaxID=3712 RepID=A0A3P6BVN8_BRAOL|nr:unnamed protein product [Brassica oleracea]